MGTVYQYIPSSMKCTNMILLVLGLLLLTTNIDSQSAATMSGGRYYWHWVVACSQWAVESQDRYICTREGKIECRDGWQWNMCEGPMCAYLETPNTFCPTPKCSEGCDPVNGKCEIPNTCDCLNGFEGQNCTEMISHPFCKNGLARSALEQCVCYEGWQGDLCDIPVCKEGCSRRNGYCLEPFQCLCKLGWKGETCDTCAPYPGCQFGTCKKPWECTCQQGYSGTYCNETTTYIGESFRKKFKLLKDNKDENDDKKKENDNQKDDNNVNDKKNDDDETKENGNLENDDNDKDKKNDDAETMENDNRKDDNNANDKKNDDDETKENDNQENDNNAKDKKNDDDETEVNDTQKDSINDKDKKNNDDGDNQTIDDPGNKQTTEENNEEKDKPKMIEKKVEAEVPDKETENK